MSLAVTHGIIGRSVRPYVLYVLVVTCCDAALQHCGINERQHLHGSPAGTHDITMRIALERAWLVPE